MRTTSIIFVLAAMLTAAPGCDLDVGDLNNPGIDELEDNPTAVTVASACTGLLIGNRRNRAAGNGYVVQLGILGREAYNFDQADPRFVGELLQGTLNAGSPFGGNFWQLPYANIRLANTILTSVDKVDDFSATDKAGIRGFAKTIIAFDLLEVISTRDDIGAVIKTDNPVAGPLGPIADKTAVLAEIARLLDEGAMDLTSGGTAFVFPLSNGYAGFDTPMTFRAVNRAIRARVAAYQKNYPAVLAALGESFIDDTVTTVEELNVGAYYSYSTGTGDTTNGLVNPNIYAHPSLATDAMMNGTAKDQRYTRKVRMTAMPGSAQGLTSNLAFSIYSSPSSPVALIRNEELLLLRAEAKFFTSDVPGAVADLNIVRTVSGGLMPHTGTPAEADFVTALLYEREFSLLMEGHRWIDARRFGRLDSLPLDDPEHTRNRRYPLPIAECNARPNEPACELDSV
jgi:starch-binding outer membrane protein, SusD/RagB family